MKLLAFTEFDGPNVTPLIIAHGLFGAGRNWRGLARRFAKTRPVVTVDMRNHGASFWDEEHSYEAMAGDLASLIKTKWGRADVLGHSMGGKAAMLLALQNPNLVRDLIVADIAPKSYDHSHTDLIANLQSLDISNFTRRSEIEKATQEFTPSKAEAAFFAQGVVLSPAGNHWQLNLGALRAEMSKIVGFPDVKNACFEGRTHFICGANSTYVQEEDWTEIFRLFPNYTHIKIQNAGHWVHAENPTDFVSTTLDFLRE